jgi:hypothetical protein
MVNFQTSNSEIIYRIGSQKCLYGKVIAPALDSPVVRQYSTLKKTGEKIPAHIRKCKEIRERLRNHNVGKSFLKFGNLEPVPSKFPLILKILLFSLIYSK